MYEILIVDDEPAARERLARIIEEFDSNNWHVAQSVENGRSAVSFCEQSPVNIVLMDIRMPGMDGIEAAALLAQMPRSPVVIFTTAYGEYALDAFDAQGAGYLLKPVKPAKLLAALERAALLCGEPQSPSQQNDAAQGTLFVSGHCHGALQRVELNEVLFFLAEDKYVKAHTADRALLLDDSLKTLELRFSEYVTRIHRNALVLTQHLTGIEKKQGAPVMALLAGTDVKLEISRRHTGDVKEIIKLRK